MPWLLLHYDHLFCITMQKLLILSATRQSSLWKDGYLSNKKTGFTSGREQLQSCLHGHLQFLRLPSLIVLHSWGWCNCWWNRRCWWCSCCFLALHATLNRGGGTASTKRTGGKACNIVTNLESISSLNIWLLISRKDASQIRTTANRMNAFAKSRG